MLLKNRLLLGAGCVVAFSGLIGPALAQDASVETVVVTGSRLGQAGLNAPTPVTAVSAADLQNSAPSGIADALTNLPSLVQAGGQRNNSGSTSTGKNVLNLRGLGATRSLILLDGMRFPSTQNNNTVDTNVLPQALVRRVDIVTGGASASYGSDAVAGVVNFILDDRYEGIGASVSAGSSEYGDNLEFHTSVNFGTSLMGGRMHLIGSGDYIDNFGAPGNSRPWRANGDANAIVDPTNSSNFILVKDSRAVGSFGGYTAGGAAGTLIPAANRTANVAAISNLQFDNDGNLVPYNKGTNNNGSFQNGGDGINTSIIQDVSRPLRRRSAFIRGTYDITDNMSFFVEGIYGHSDAQQNNGEFAVGANAPTIRSDNPYLSPAAATRIASLVGATTAGATSGAGFTGGGTVTVSKYFPYDPKALESDNMIEYKNDDRMTTQVVAGGLNGRLWDKYDWAITANHGYTREYTSTDHSLNLVNLKLAADATTFNGQIVCRSTITNPTNGCVPINIFGTNNLTAAGIQYITDQNPVVYNNETTSAEFHVNGPLFDLPAGPVSAALGGEYRRQRDTVISGANDVAKVYQLGTVQPWQGGYDVTEGFVEVGIPLLANMPLISALDANVAARITNYSTGKAVVTWKGGLVWKVTDTFTLRSTVSRDIRAPNPADLFSGGSQGTSNVTDPFRNNESDRGIRMTTVGNANLAPERGTTITAGIAYSPEFIPGLGLTVDYYDIRLAGVIAVPSTQNVINFCFQGNAAYCPFIERNAIGGAQGGQIIGVTSSNQNLNALRTNGVDIEATYAVPGSDWFDWWEGDLTIRSVANILGIRTTNIPLAQSTYAAGNISSDAPHMKANTTFTYDLGQWSTYVQYKFIGPGLWNNTYNNPTSVPFTTSNFNHVSSAHYFDVQETFHMNANINLYLNVQNVLDARPQLNFANSNYAQVTNEGLYDEVGRMFRVGIRLKY